MKRTAEMIDKIRWKGGILERENCVDVGFYWRFGAHRI